MSQYTQGTLRKSKREKEKEREEAKKREEEELAAKTYAEYLDAFEGGSSQRKGSSFVRASSSARGEDISYDPLAREGRSSVAKAFNAEESTVRSLYMRNLTIIPMRSVIILARLLSTF